MMKRDELNSKKEKVSDFKTKANHMQRIAEILRQMPKGQIKKLQADDELKEIFALYGVEL